MSRDRRRQNGSAMIYVVIGATALIGFAALATETGRAWYAKNQLQAAADSSALAGVAKLLTGNFTTVDEAGARTAATNMVGQHKASGTVLSLPAADVEAGSWDLATETFTALPGNTNADVMRALRVITRRDGNANGPLTTILGQAIGVASLDVNADAIAYMGFAGTAGPGEVDLPIAIDCCAISGNTPGSACTQNYCDTIQNNPPNPCSWNGTTTSCLEFHSTPEQNACWTEFEGDNPSINTPGLTDIVNNNNPYAIEGPIFLDNGDKVPVLRDIDDRFRGNGNFAGNPAGTDTDSDGTVDSWVVRLPVVECQNPGDNCAGGDPSNVVGFVCFDIHDVETTPAKIIKGDFVCPTDPRCSNLGLGPGGTLPSGISASYPVIVE